MSWIFCHVANSPCPPFSGDCQPPDSTKQMFFGTKFFAGRQAEGPLAPMLRRSKPGGTNIGRPAVTFQHRGRSVPRTDPAAK